MKRFGEAGVRDTDPRDDSTGAPTPEPRPAAVNARGYGERRTLVATVSIGARSRYARYSLPRLEAWCRRHKLDSVVVRENLIPANRPPHFNKLAIPARYSGYDRYVIIDDDLLLARHAPAPPEVGGGKVALVPDPEQNNTRAGYVGWTGNTGFIVAAGDAAPLLADALARGSDETIWGFADQSALNRSVWQAGQIEKLDPRWNFMPVPEHILRRSTWERWRTSRIHRLRFYLGLALGVDAEYRRRLTTSFGVHLVRAPYPWFFSRLMG